MRKILLLILLLLSIKSWASEEIRNYTTEITVNHDRSVTVKETIAVNVEGINIKRGIYRDIINVQVNEHNRSLRYPVRVIEVLKDGSPEHYAIENLNEAVRVKIGSSDVMLPHGVHTYEITYSMPEQVRFFNDYDEIYWNAIGAQWEFPINNAEAIVHLPEGAKIIQSTGYSGSYGDEACQCNIQKNSENTISFKMTSPLSSYEGLTVAVGFGKGIIPPPTDAEKDRYVAKPTVIFVTGIGGFSIVFLIYIIAWYFVGRDPKEGTIIPRFHPNEKISPAASRSLSKMGFDNKNFTASIINLAVKGAIKITKTEKGYSLKKMKDNPYGIFKEEKKIFDKLLGSRETFSIGGSYNSKLEKALQDHEKLLKKELVKTYFNRNQGWLIPGIIISVITMIAAFISTFIYDAETFVSLVPIGFLMIFFFPVISILFKKLISSKRITQVIVIILVVLAIGFAGYNYFGILDNLEINSIVDINVIYFFEGLLVSFITLHVLFSYLLKAPTLAGRKLMDEVDGLKMYLDIAEKDRLALIGAPEQTVEHFETLLPYAIALDVEKHWSQRFETILAESSGPDGYQPGWYSGPLRGYALASFTSDISRSFNSSISSASTPPPSSSSSSGSFGGGFSGGGGGGGGGGGW